MSTTKTIRPPLLAISELVEHEPGYLLGTIDVGGASLHCEFIRVMTDEEDGHEIQTAWRPNFPERNDNVERYSALQAYYDGVYETLRLPALDGDWICVCFPYAT